MRKRIALDLDGVVYRWTDTACYLLNHHLGYEIRPGDVNSWNYLEEQVTKKHWSWLWDDGIKLGLFRHGSLYKGAVDGIKRLMNLGKVVVVTSRPKSASVDTLNFLANLQIPFTEIHILDRGSKSAIRPKFDLAIDDSPRQIAEYRSEGIPVIAPISGQNSKYLHEQKDLEVYPTESWDGITEEARVILGRGN